MAEYVGAIDQGTTSTRFMIFDHDGRELARYQLAHEQIRPQDGWVEHDPHEIWEATQDVIAGALGRAGITAADLAAIGITNQCETTVVWDRRTGEPYYNAIVREDVRTGTQQASGLAGTAGTGTGTGAGIQWVLENVDDVRADADAGHAIFGTIDSWLIWWLTGGPDDGLHVTDVTNAGCTMLMDLHTLVWDDELLALLGVPRSMMPQIRSSSEVFGRTLEDGPFSGEVVIAGVLGDQQAGLVGQVCLRPGDLTMTYGSLVLNTGHEIVRSGDGVRTTLAYQFGEAPAVYSSEGSIVAADLTGQDRAALEATAHQIREVVDAMTVDTGLDPQVLRVDGEAGANDLGMQTWANVLGVPVSRPVVSETAALGSAYAAGLAVGFWTSTDEMVVSWNESRAWEPTSTQAERDAGHARWKEGVGHGDGRADVG